MTQDRTDYWVREFSGGDYSLLFALAYKLDDRQDLTQAARDLPQGMVIVSTRVLAGKEHVESVLIQAREYWKRGEFLARNKSIDLLMRMTGQAQIQDAVRAANNSDTNAFVLLGFAQNFEKIDEARRNLETAIQGGFSRDDSLIELDETKLMHLKKFHGLPTSLSRSQLVVALKEKSLLLAFSR